MLKPAVILRWLLIVAFCLDGTATLWKGSAMAVSMVGRAQSEQSAGDHHRPQVATTATASKQAGACTDAQGGDVHQCDCDMSGACDCSCAFAVKLLAGGVPFAAQHVLSVAPGSLPPTGPAVVPVPAPLRPPIA